jgi:hypothetical protein
MLFLVKKNILKNKWQHFQHPINIKTTASNSRPLVKWSEVGSGNLNWIPRPPLDLKSQFYGENPPTVLTGERDVE